MNYDYGIVYKMCRPRKDGFFIETSILYRICSARSPSQLPILNKTPYKCLKVISFHDLVILNSYCGGFLIGQIHKKGSNDKQTKRTNCKKHHARSSADVSGDDNFNIRMGILAMNELITKEMLEGGYVPDVIFDKLEEYKTAVEWFETFKFQARVAMEKNHVKKWETDYFVMDYIDEHKSPKIDTKRMKETWFDIVDSNGEVTKVNAYDFFVKQTNVKAHTSYKEKK